MQALSLSLGLAVVLSASAATADPIVVERVVARVDGRPVLLSEVRQAAKPYLLRLTRPVDRAAGYRRVYRETLAHRIEHALIAIEAERRHLSVSDDDIETALVAIEKNNGFDRNRLLAEVRSAGLDEAAYRREISEQVLEQRVIYAFGLDKVRPYPDTDEARAKWFGRVRSRLLDEVRKEACIERWVRW